MNDVEWTPDLIEALRALRRNGYSSDHCATMLGIGRDTCQGKLRELGINHRMNCGRRPGPVVASMK